MTFKHPHVVSLGVRRSAEREGGRRAGRAIRGAKRERLDVEDSRSDGYITSVARPVITRAAAQTTSRLSQALRRRARPSFR